MIYQVIDSYEVFWDWLRNSDTYREGFSMVGAAALFEYYASLDGAVIFDPMAWAMDWAEYENFAEFQRYNWDVKTLGELKEIATVLEPCGKLLVRQF